MGRSQPDPRIPGVVLAVFALVKLEKMTLAKHRVEGLARVNVVVKLDLRHLHHRLIASSFP